MLTIEEWTAELRKGDRIQGQGRLHEVLENGVEKFCCLGVVQDMLHKQGEQDRILWEAQPEDSIPTQYAYVDPGGFEEIGTLTKQAADKLGIPQNPPIAITFHENGTLKTEVYLIAQLNDSGFTFSQLADVIDYFYGGNNDR
jgi:hypothetical protein